MKLVFVHSTKLIEDDEGNLYTGGSFNSQVWQRYLDLTEKITVIARKEPIKTKKKEAEKKYNYFDKNKIKFKEVSNLSASVKSIFNIKERMQVSSIIEQEVLNSDCIIARLPSIYGYIAIKYAKKHNKRYLIEVVGCAWDALWNHSKKGKILAPLSYISMKRAVKNAPYAIYVSENFLQNRYPCNGKTLSCSDVLLDSMNNKILDERLYRIGELKTSTPTVLGTIAGVDVRYKGQRYVIEAISRLNKHGYNFEYHLVGGGNQSYLRGLAEKYKIEDKVKFLGALPHKEVFEFIRNIDIYIQPSNAESHGRVIVEAMSCACPVIGSSTGGIPELVSQEFVFKRKNVSDLENKIKKMTKEKMIYEAKRSFEKVQEFQCDLLNQKRTEFYSDFTKESKNRSRK